MFEELEQLKEQNLLLTETLKTVLKFGGLQTGIEELILETLSKVEVNE